MEGGARVVRSGWLKKSPRGRTFGVCVWRRRWFVLRSGGRPGEEGVLEYYASSLSEKPRASLDLRLCQAVNSGVTFHKRRQPDGCVFTIETSQRTFHLSARTEEDMDEWVQSLCRLCHLGLVGESTESWKKEVLAGPGIRSFPADFSTGAQPPCVTSHPSPTPGLQPTSPAMPQEPLFSHLSSNRAPGSARNTDNFVGHASANVLVTSAESVWSFIPDKGQQVTVARNQTRDFCGLSKPHWHAAESQEKASRVLQSPTDPGKSKCGHTGPQASIPVAHKLETRRSTLYQNADYVSRDNPGVPRVFTWNENHQSVVMGKPRSPAVVPMCPSQKQGTQKAPVGNNGGSFSANAIAPGGGVFPVVDDRRAHSALPLKSSISSWSHKASEPGVTGHREWSPADHMAPILEPTKGLSAPVRPWGKQGTHDSAPATKEPPIDKLDEPAPATDEPPTEIAMKTRRLKQLVNRLVYTLLQGDPFFLPSFLCFYRNFGSTQQVLDLLFKTHGYLCCGREEDEHIKKTLCFILRTWLDRYPEDFFQSTDLSDLHRLMGYVQHVLPCSDLADHMKLYLLHLEDPLLREPELEDKIQPPPIYRHLKPDRKTESVTPNPDSKADLEQPHSGLKWHCHPWRAGSSTPDLGLGPTHGTAGRDGKTPHIFLPSWEKAPPTHWGAEAPASRRSPRQINYVDLDFQTNSARYGCKPFPFSVHSDEKVQYAVLDQEKTQALQYTREEWADIWQGIGP